MAWNFNISKAPKGDFVNVTRSRKDEEVTFREYRPTKIILATKCGKVIVSHWLNPETPEGGRWNFLAKDEQPIAWMPFPVHPNAEGV